ncbi:hypothetical protein Y032_0018g3492 [Ancylostoma ceylanicum]|uniref:GPN-loop GTPase 2 n=1 Tax=Ancylostoma ceylanicum TaxID=53326 RepID=A0A016V3X5_9BILA|nr:hypothetical protein Y032_0018g3492 [Ancylostoma ceylanicum]
MFELCLILLLIHSPHSMFPEEIYCISDFVHSHATVSLGLGPNGALKYCIDTLCRNRTWLLQKILDNKGKYLIIDCPGQLELYKSEGELWKVISLRYGT